MFSFENPFIAASFVVVTSDPEVGGWDKIPPPTGIRIFLLGL